jgi:molecular chaperone GrpE
MTDQEQRDDEERPKVRIVDKRRFREGDAAPAEHAGAASPSSSPADGPVSTGAEMSAGQSDAETSEIELVRAQAAEYRDHLQRLQADFENYRKRTTRSQERLVEAELQRFVQQLLEVLDEFDLALLAAEREPDFEGFRKGVELVYAKLADTLRTEGLERIEAEGKPFDPTEHEALMQTGEGDGEPHVAEIFRQGYRLRGSVIRPASVRVERR